MFQVALRDSLPIPSRVPPDARDLDPAHNDARMLNPARLYRSMEMRHRAWRWATKKDPAEIAWMCSVLNPGDVVIDAGAYKGGYTYTMRREVGPTGRVYAFEPQPELAAFLRRGIEANGWENVSVEEAGLSNQPGEATLHASAEGPSQLATLVEGNADTDARTYTVRLESLDTFVEREQPQRPIAFIKCDVEGNELKAFQGAEGLLRDDKPRLLFECESRHEPTGSVATVFDYIRGLGYRGFFFLEGKRVALEDFVPDTHQVLGNSTYINLFAFEPQ